MIKKAALFFGVLLAILGALVALSSIYASEKSQTAPAVKPQSALPRALLNIEKNYTQSKTTEAEFEQTNFAALTGVKKQSSGYVSLKYPDKFRWETLKPDKSLLVSDGRFFWFYTPPFDEGERGQVIQKKTSEVQSQLASSLLSGAFSKMKDVKIQKISATKFKLLPKKGSAGTVSSAEITINPKKNTIDAVRLEHEGGNTAEIKLKNIRLKTKIDDGFFKFTTPPNTDMIKE